MEENDNSREPLKENQIHKGAVGHVEKDKVKCVDNIIRYLKSKIEDEERGRE